MSKDLNFTMQQQQQSEWCWAAVSTSAALFYNPASPWTQCTLVNAQLNQTTCCQGGSASPCNQPWFLESALQATGNLDHFSTGSEPLPSVENQIAKGAPLGVRIGWQGGGGHFIAVVGYDDSQPGAETVTVADPLYGPSIVSYSTFLNSYQGSGSWTHSYFTKQAESEAPNVHQN